jgi:beta-phosphoglucomutase-like phosphatase (HAD superfamily)
MPPGIQCVIDVARAYKAKGIPIACATSGVKDIVDVHLEHAGAKGLFEVIVYAADLPGRGKPLPDIFLEAARRLGVKEPRNCRAYEDGEAGLNSAYAAGMQVGAVGAVRLR